MVTLFEKGRISQEETSIITEFPLQITVNGQRLVNLLCTPRHLKELVIGFLFTEGLIFSLEDIIEVKIGGGKADVRIRREMGDRGGGMVPWIMTGCGQNVVWPDRGDRDCIFNIRIESRLALPAAVISSRIHQMQRVSALYQKTRGVHGAALADAQDLIIFREDIGRHNAVDKVVGSALCSGVTIDDKLLLTTGRISSEILVKAARLKVPFIVSRSVPTDYAVWLGRALGITIVGFVRGDRLKVYTHDWRVLGNI
ncbi:formate dehydrogenase accessory sulfurtransferase FdhD [Moorella sp. ACPs]|uniref:formate dehydrogenase accessory sulfurtransferase FdhD n=1 Tax=Neomoorella carbonis TaxID=3062783 RepID=UPI00387324BF